MAVAFGDWHSELTREAFNAMIEPKLRASLYADYALPWVNGLAVLGGVQYSAKTGLVVDEVLERLVHTIPAPDRRCV